MVAGLRQLDRLAFRSMNLRSRTRRPRPFSFAFCGGRTSNNSSDGCRTDHRMTKVAFTTALNGESFDLVLNTRLFLYRNAVRRLMEASISPPEIISPSNQAEPWEGYFSLAESIPPLAGEGMGVHHGWGTDRPRSRWSFCATAASARTVSSPDT